MVNILIFWKNIWIFPKEILTLCCCCTQSSFSRDLSCEAISRQIETTWGCFIFFKWLSSSGVDKRCRAAYCDTLTKICLIPSLYIYITVLLGNLRLVSNFELSIYYVKIRWKKKETGGLTTIWEKSFNKKKVKPCIRCPC